MKPTLIIMAAGMGSRYGKLKQIDPVGMFGETIMEYSVYDAVKAGFGEVVFVIRRDFEQEFCEFVIDKFKKKIRADYVFQELDDLPEGFTCPDGRQKPWGASQAVLSAQEKITTPFAVINADDFYGQGSFRIMHDYLSGLKATSTSYAMIGYRLDKTLSAHGTVSRGICKVSPEGYLQEVLERTKIGWLDKKIVYYDERDIARPLEGNAQVSMNFWGFTPRVFAQINDRFIRFLEQNGQELKSEYTLPTAVDDTMKSGYISVRVLPSREQWFGITYQEDKPVVMQRIRDLTKAGLYPGNLWGK